MSVQIAFLATEVQCPVYTVFDSGFQSPGSHRGVAEHSFAAVDDETGEPPETRVTAWLTSAPGNKVVLWDTVPEAV